jgi:hypothetical protein
MGSLSIQPQILNVGIELLADIHLTGFQSDETGIVVGVDGVRKVLRSGQLAPHGSILTPVVVVTNEDNFLVVIEEFLVRARATNVFAGIGFQSSGIATGALFQFLGPGFLDNIVAAQVSRNLQRD